MGRCYVLVLGPIGSGKSTVARRLAEMGADVFDADSFGHRVLAEEAFGEIADRWPQAVKSGQIDRGRLASIVFRDAGELAALEAITHPHIAARLLAAVARSEREVIVIELPLIRRLLPGRWLRVVVDAPEETRLARLVERGMDEHDARRRIEMQPRRAAWLEVADLVIDNGGEEALLDVQLKELAQILEGCDDRPR